MMSRTSPLASSVVARAHRGARGNSAGRRLRFGADLEHLEDRRLLAASKLTDAIPLGALPTTEVDKQGTITSDIGGDLYSFTVTQGQTVQVNLVYPGEAQQSHFNGFVTQLYETATTPGGSLQFRILTGDPQSNTNLDPPRPTAFQGLNGPYFRYTFDGMGFDANANASANGLFYLYVATNGGGSPPPTLSLFSDGSINDETENFTVPAAYTLQITATNPTAVIPPVAVADTATTAENQSVSINVLANDTDPSGFPLTITGVSSAATGGMANQSAQGGQLTTSQGGVTYSPPTGYSGQDSFSYTISNGHGGTAVGTVTITISPPAPPAPASPAVSFVTPRQKVFFTAAGGVRGGGKNANVLVDLAVDNILRNGVEDTVKVAFKLDEARTTAIPGRNFRGPTSGTFTFNPGETLKSIPIQLISDKVKGVVAPLLTVAYKITDVVNGVEGAVTEAVIDLAYPSFGAKQVRQLQIASEAIFKNGVKSAERFQSVANPILSEIASAKTRREAGGSFGFLAPGAIDQAINEYSADSPKLINDAVVVANLLQLSRNYNDIYSGDPLFDATYAQVSSTIRNHLVNLLALKISLDATRDTILSGGD